MMHLRNINEGVAVTIFSDNRQSHLKAADLDDFKAEFSRVQINFKRTDNTIHDRYIILDYGRRGERIYHCGASSKDAGRKATTITEIQDRMPYRTVIDDLLQKPDLVVT